MKNPATSMTWVGGCILAALVAASPARATLGEQSDAGETVRQSVHGARAQATTGALYTVHQVVSTHVTVREYADQHGKVFAVAWDGDSHPDLTAILGRYMDDMQTASQRLSPQAARTRRIEMHGDDVVIIKSGHMHSVHGKAYVTSLLPDGVKVDEIN